MDTKIKKTAETAKKVEIAALFGKMFGFNSSLKLYHWHVSGPKSYSQHIALDQAIGDLSDNLDRIVETSFAMYGDLEITIPATPMPKNIVKHAEDFYREVEAGRELFGEAFTQAIIDDYVEAIQQLLYRLKRLQ